MRAISQHLRNQMTVRAFLLKKRGGAIAMEPQFLLASVTAKAMCWTSAVFAEVLEFLTVLAIAMGMWKTNVVFVVVQEPCWIVVVKTFCLAPAIVRAMSRMSAGFATGLAFLRVNATVKAMCWMSAASVEVQAQSMNAVVRTFCLEPVIVTGT